MKDCPCCKNKLKEKLELLLNCKEKDALIKASGVTVGTIALMILISYML